jgi:hypothetical protein
LERLRYEVLKLGCHGDEFILVIVFSRLVPAFDYPDTFLICLQVFRVNQDALLANLNVRCRLTCFGHIIGADRSLDEPGRVVTHVWSPSKPEVLVAALRDSCE